MALKYSFYGEDEQEDPQNEQRTLQTRYEVGLHLVEAAEKSGKNDDYQLAVATFELLIKDLGNCCMTVDGIAKPVRHRFKERLREVCLKNLGLCLVKLNQHQRALKECYLEILEECKEIILWLNAADAAKGANSLYAARYFASAPLQWKNLTATEAILVKAKSREIEEWCQHLALSGAGGNFSRQMITHFSEEKNRKKFIVFVEDRTIDLLIDAIYTHAEAGDVPLGDIDFYVDNWPLTHWRPTTLNADVDNIIRAVGQFLTCQGRRVHGVPLGTQGAQELSVEHVVHLVCTGGMSAAVPDAREVADVEDFCREYMPWRMGVKRLLLLLLESRKMYLPKKMPQWRRVLSIYLHYIVQLHLCSSGSVGRSPWDFQRVDLPQPYPTACGSSLKRFLSETLVSAAELAFGCSDITALQALMGLILNVDCSPFPTSVREAFERCWKEPEADFDATVLEGQPEKTMAMRMISLLSHRCPQLLPILEAHFKTSDEPIQCTTHVIAAANLRLAKQVSQTVDKKDFVAPVEWVETSRGIKNVAIAMWNRLRSKPHFVDGEVDENHLQMDFDNDDDVRSMMYQLAALTAKLRKLGQQTTLKGQLFSTSPIGVTSWSYLLLIITALVSTRVNLLPICQAGIVILARHLIQNLRRDTNKTEVVQKFGLLVMFHDVDVALGVRFLKLVPKERTVEFCYPLHSLVDHETFQSQVDFISDEISSNAPLPHLILKACATMRTQKLEQWQLKAKIPRRSHDFTQDLEVGRAVSWALLRVLTAWIGGTQEPVLFDKDRLLGKALNGQPLDALRDLSAPLGMYRKHVSVDEFRKYYCDGMKPDEVEEAITKFVAKSDHVQPPVMFGTCVAGPHLDIQSMGLLWALQMAFYTRPAGTNCAAQLLQHLNPIVFGEKTYSAVNYVPMTDVVCYLFHPLIMPRFYIIPLRMAERTTGLYPIMMEPIMRLVHKLSGSDDYWCSELNLQLTITTVGRLWQQIAQLLQKKQKSRVDGWERAKSAYEILQQVEPVTLHDPLADIYYYCAMHSQSTDIQYLNNNSSFTRGSPTLLFCAQDLAHSPLRWQTLEIAACTYQIMFLGRRDEKCARHALNILDVLWFHYESVLSAGDFAKLSAGDFAKNATKWYGIQRDRLWLFLALKQKPVAQQIAHDLLSFIAHNTTCGLDSSFAGSNLFPQLSPIEFDKSFIFFFLCVARIPKYIEEAKRWTETKYPHCIQLRAKIKEIKRSGGKDDIEKVQIKSLFGDDAAEYAAWISSAGASAHFDAHLQTLCCLEKALEKRHVETPSLQNTQNPVLNLQRYKSSRKSKFNELARRSSRGYLDSLSSIPQIADLPWPTMCTPPSMEQVMQKIWNYPRLPLCTVIPAVQGHMLELADYRWYVQVKGPNWSLATLFHALKVRADKDKEKRADSHMLPLFEKSCGQVYLDAAGYPPCCHTIKSPPGYSSWMLWFEAVDLALKANPIQPASVLGKRPLGT